MSMGFTTPPESGFVHAGDLVGAFAHITGRLEQPGAFRLDDEQAIRILMTMPSLLGAMSGEKNEEIADLAGAAYQVVGSVAAAGGIFDHPDVQRALDYFADPKGEILPFVIAPPFQTPIGGWPCMGDPAVSARLEAMSPEKRAWVEAYMEAEFGGKSPTIPPVKTGEG